MEFHGFVSATCALRASLHVHQIDLIVAASRIDVAAARAAYPALVVNGEGRWDCTGEGECVHPR